MLLRSNQPVYKVYLDALDRARAETDGIFSGGAPTAVGGNLQVTVAAYTGMSNGTFRSGGPVTVTLNAADATLPRVDIIHLDTTGTVVVTAGSPAASYPLPPTLPAGSALIAVVNLGSNQSALVTATDITDARAWLAKLSGTLANRPTAAAANNRMYTVTDAYAGPRVFRSDGSAWTQVVPDVVHSGGIVPMRTANSYYHSLFAAIGYDSISTYSVVANSQYAIPFIVAKTTTIVSLNVYTSTAGGVYRMAIYKDGTDSYPGALVAQTAELTSTVGDMPSALIGGNVTLEPGVYWFSWWGNGGPVTYSKSFQWSPLGSPNGTVSRYAAYAFSATYTAGTSQMPANYPASVVPSLTNNLQLMNILYRNA